MEKLEKQLAGCETKLADIEQALADETLYQPDNKQRLTTLLAEQGALRQQQEQIEESMLLAMEELEQAEQALE